MDEFRQIEIDLSASELVVRLDSFKRRAADLSAFVKTQRWGVQHIHIDRSNEYSPTVGGTLQNDLILEGLYRRFRFFILNDELSSYHRFSRLLSAAANDELFQRYLRIERRDFYQSGSLDFAFVLKNAKYGPKEVIDFWFNAYYFHDQPIERQKLTKFEKIVSPEGAKILLWECVWNSIRKVRNLASLVRDATPENPVVYVPIYSRL